MISEEIVQSTNIDISGYYQDVSKGFFGPFVSSSIGITIPKFNGFYNARFHVIEMASNSRIIDFPAMTTNDPQIDPPSDTELNFIAPASTAGLGDYASVVANY